jgi:hypothetical protein
MEPDFLPIPDPRVKKAPNPGSRSATLTASYVPYLDLLASAMTSIPGTLDSSVGNPAYGSAWIHIDWLSWDSDPY